jgi:hypothetical protein
VVVLVACGTDAPRPRANAELKPTAPVAHSAAPPERPDPTHYEHMTADERCAAVAPRASECADELLIAETKTVAPDRAGVIEPQLRSSPPATGNEARDMIHASCLGWIHSQYPDAVIACWNVPGCKPFAACVTERLKLP